MMVRNADNKYKQLRLKSNMSISEACKKLKIHISTLYRIERGNQLPGIKLKLKMCSAYNATLLELQKGD